MPRVVNGNSFTENGWPMASEEETDWVTVPGTRVTLQIQKGQPTALLRAWAADYNEFIERLRDPDSACWTPGNSVLGQPGRNNGSNHLGGTAMDLNWDSHPFQVDFAGYTPQMIAVMEELEDFYEGMVFWAQRWHSPKDAMHHQMGYDTYGVPGSANFNRVNNFIARKIRADGFSTFRRGNAPVTAAPILAAATGLSEVRAAEILPAVRAGLKASECTSVNRIAMWLAQVGHESVSFLYTEEIAKNGRYAPYIGRTWIQITWDYNYRAFSEWCFAQGLVPSADYFVVNYRALADLEWAGLGASWYWMEQRPMNALTDAGESARWGDYRGFAAVTAAINGGTNGIDDRRSRYNQALGQGDALLQILNEGDDFLSALNNDEQRELLDLARQQAGVRRKSLSPLRWPYEGEVNTCAGFAWATDANVHVIATERLAVEYGDTMAIVLLSAVAHTDEPGRADDAVLAQHILNKVSPDSYLAAKAKVDAWLAAEAAHNAA